MSVKQKKPMRLVLTGGGTAGHVWPNFALVEDTECPLGLAVAEQRVGIYYLGSNDGMERELVERYAPSWTYLGIQTGKLRRYFSFKNFTDPVRIVVGCVQAFLHLYRVQATVVFSKGGFVSAPVVWAAWLQGIPVVIHESDVTPALATRLTLPFCYRALTAFEETAKYCAKMFRGRMVALGLPIRPSLFSAPREKAFEMLSLDSTRKTILVSGGSLGADGMNKKIAPALAGLSQKYNVIHICGKGKTFDLPGASQTYRQFEFLKEEMRFAYAISDLSICRAGASSIFELAAARIPMILIPLGLHQSRGDQIVNAKIFASRGWAQWIAQEDLTTEMLVSLVEQTMTNLVEKKTALNSAPGTDATRKIGNLLLNIMERREDVKKFLPENGSSVELSEEQILEFAREFLTLLQPETWIFLEGDLGAGKTTFVKAIAALLEVENITSPTFSILNTINLKENILPGVERLLHLDLYRIKSGRELCYLGIEQEFGKGSIAFFEWPSMIDFSEWSEFFAVTGCRRPQKIMELTIARHPEDAGARIYTLKTLATANFTY